MPPSPVACQGSAFRETQYPVKSFQSYSVIWRRWIGRMSTAFLRCLAVAEMQRGLLRPTAVTWVSQLQVPASWWSAICRRAYRLVRTISVLWKLYAIGSRAAHNHTCSESVRVHVSQKGNCIEIYDEKHKDCEHFYKLYYLILQKGIRTSLTMVYNQQKADLDDFRLVVGVRRLLEQLKELLEKKSEGQ